MDMGLVILAGAVILAAAIILFFAFRGGRTEADANRHVAELAGRLSQMAGAQASALAQMSERLQAQERLLTKMLEERLDTVTTRVSATLEKSSQAQAETLGELRERIARIDAAQANITELSSQMVSLQQILSNKQARGSFGELQLQDLVQSVLPPSAYRFQATIGDNKRVDCLLDLPNPPGPIAIDAKFPLESYVALRDADDDGARVQAARSLRTDMMKHIGDIAEKYIVPGHTAEAALLFLPSEAVYAELHANFADVIEQSYRKRVFIVSPTTLWATLNTIRAVLKDVRMRELAGVIQKEVMALLGDVRRLDERVGKLQSHFNQTSEDVRQIRISTDKVVKRAESIEELEFDDADGNAALPAAPAQARAQDRSAGDVEKL
ncbi:MAG TPA: DNA recombination protein RmuC [Alphaproteobacteria bacterium]|nr:DNA recombination protein RmuC [Alphaproteobacteria bacterium]